jgi:hypothetical protein
LVGLYLVPFAGIVFLWFIGVVRDRVGEREDNFFATERLRDSCRPHPQHQLLRTHRDHLRRVGFGDQHARAGVEWPAGAGGYGTLTQKH